MTREELVQLVSNIKYCKGTESEIDEWVSTLKQNVIYPQITDLIFFDEKDPEEIVDIALSYKPICL